MKLTTFFEQNVGVMLKVALCIVLIVSVVSFFILPKKTKTENILEVYFFDVGQADCTLLRLNGYTMLIDAGNSNDARNNLKITSNINLVYELKKRLGIKRIDYFINTHTHEDHMGGSSIILNNFDVGMLIVPGNMRSTDDFYQDFEKIVSKKKIKCVYPTSMSDFEILLYENRRKKYYKTNLKGYKYVKNEYIQIGDSFKFGDARVTIVAPSSSEYEIENDYSITLKVEYQGKSILFTGDIEKTAEKEILQVCQEKGISLKSDVLKVPHHGSDTSTTQEFFNAVNPKYAVIFCGWDNPYGHPADSVISRLRENRTKIFRTDMLGDIIMYIKNDEITFDTWSYWHTRKE